MTQINNEVVNPFDPATAPGVQLIVLMRIYDALMALLQTQDEELHNKLDALHESGQLGWSLPFLDIKSAESDVDQSLPPVES